MTRFVEIQKWAHDRFEGKVPSARVLMKMCRNGEIKRAKKMGRTWYVAVSDENTVGESK